MTSKQAGNRVGRFILIVLMFIVLVLLGCSRQVGAKAGEEVASTPPAGTFDPVSGDYDWQPQDYKDSQAITTVVYNPVRQCLVATGNWRGGDEKTAKGEIYLDLRFVPELEGKVPIDLSRTRVEFIVEVPGGFNHRFSIWEREIPNGMQPFGKDGDWRCQYGTWENTVSNRTSATTYRLTHKFIRGNPFRGYSDEGFDPTKIIVLGMKFAIGDGSQHSYSGPVYIKSINFDPPIAITPRPANKPLPNIFSSRDQVTIRDRAFFLNGKKWFVVGGNWRGLEYGQNFGATLWWPWGNGITRHVNYVDCYLQRFQNSGIKVIRVGLVKDGRVILSPDGKVIGYDEIFKQDVKKLLDMAASHDIKVEFTLLDYLIAGKAETVNDVQLRGHGHLITNANVTQHFLEDFLKPFLREFGLHPALMSIDCINEPEWLVSAKEGGGWDEFSDKRLKAPEPIPLDAFRSFVSKSIEVIKAEAPTLLVTIGVSSKYAGLIEGLPVDYYALHHYPHFGDLRQYLKHIPTGMAWVLEEYPTRGTTMSHTQHLNLVKELGGNGALLWNLRPDSDEYTFLLSERDAQLIEIRDWMLANRSVTLPGDVVPSPAKATRPTQEGYAVEVWDISSGQRVHRMLFPDTEANAAAPLLSPDGSKVAARRGNGVIIVKAKGNPAHPVWQLDDQKWGLDSLRLVPDRFTAGGATVVIRAESKAGDLVSIHLYDAANGKMVATFPVEGWKGLYSPNSRYAAAVVGDGSSLHYRIYDFETGRSILETHAEYPTPNDVKAGGFSPDGSQFAAAYHYKP